MSKILSEYQIKLPDGNTATARVMAPESYQPNPHNTNKGSDRGDNALRHSLEQVGFARGILTAADGTVVAGNHSYSAAVEEGIVGCWIEIETDGNTGIVTRRIDWQDAQDPAAIKAAIADNVVQSHNFVPDPVELKLAVEKLDDTQFQVEPLFFTDKELALWTEKVDDMPSEDEWGHAFESLPDGDRSPFQQMTFTLHDEQSEQVKQALEMSKKMGSFDSENQNSNGNALARICEIFLTEHGNG